MNQRLLYALLPFLLSLTALGHGLAPQPPNDEARKIVFPDTDEHLTLVFDRIPILYFPMAMYGQRFG